MTVSKSSTFRPQRALFLIFALVVTAISWFDELDEYTDAHLDEALLGAGAVYATARGVNALVSFLQGTEVDAVFLTVSVGEALDPLNDLIERFAAIMLVALGSLAAQKILLEIVSDSLFSTLLSINILWLLLAIRFSRLDFFSAQKTFLILIFVRYSLVFAVIASSATDNYFLAARDSERLAAMESFRTDLSEVTTAATAAGATPEAVEEAEEVLRTLRAKENEERRSLASLEEKKASEDKKLESLIKDQPWHKRYNPLSEDPLALAEQKARVKALESRREVAEDALRATRDTIHEHEKFLDCLKSKAEGKTCGFLDMFQSRLSPASFIVQLRNINEGMSEFADNAITLLISLLVKTLLFPIAFLFLAFQALRWLTRRRRSELR